MSEMPSLENPKREILEQEIVDALKEGGIEDAETAQLLEKWTRQEEKKIDANKDPVGKIEFNRRRARLYIASGYIEEGYEVLESARMQAWNENRESLFAEIEAEMDKVEERFGSDE